jgi:DNA invertase Pin-like site-specific DNA recombinase
VYAGYIRVSRVKGREGESFISPDVQRSKIEAFAQARGLAVELAGPELDVTVSKLARPILDGIMERIRTGTCEGIIVAEPDGLSRARLGDVIKTVEEIRDAGGRLGFVNLDVDPSTKEGEFMLNTWLGMAHMQWRDYAEKWEVAKERAVARGAHVGPTPLGFDRVDGRLVPNADAPLVEKAFEISAGEGLDAALAFCRTTWPGRKWSATSARKLLANEVYKGDLRLGDSVARGVVAPVVDELTWDFAQHKAVRVPRASDEPFPLSGIARCAACGGPLVGGAGGRPGKRRRGYRCHNKDCTGRPYVYADLLEGLVLDAVRGSGAAKRRKSDVTRILRETAPIIKAREAVERWMANVDVEAEKPDEWRQELDRRSAVHAEAVATADASREAARPLPDLTEPTPAEQRQIFEQTIKTLTVTRGRAPLSERVAVVTSAA